MVRRKKDYSFVKLKKRIESIEEIFIYEEEKDLPAGKQRFSGFSRRKMS